MALGPCPLLPLHPSRPEATLTWFLPSQRRGSFSGPRGHSLAAEIRLPHGWEDARMGDVLAAQARAPPCTQQVSC